MQRSGSSPVTMQGTNTNGGAANGAMPVTLPVTAGQQLDLHLALQRILELSEVLHDNRSRTQALVATASEIAARGAAVAATAATVGPSTSADASSTRPSVAAESNANGTTEPADTEAPSVSASAAASASASMSATAPAAAVSAAAEANAKQIADLTSRSTSLQRTVRVYAREQRENARLLGEYETAVGHLTGLVRDLGAKKDAQRTSAARAANATLQAERDAHLTTRQERDAWEARFWRAVAMMREAHHRLTDEEGHETGAVRELQGEVRTLRGMVGLPVQRAEEETGWRVLRDRNDRREDGEREREGEKGDGGAGEMLTS